MSEKNEVFSVASGDAYCWAEQGSLVNNTPLSIRRLVPELVSFRGYLASIAAAKAGASS